MMRQGVDMGLHQAVVPTAAMRKGDFTGVGTLLSSSIVSNPVCQDPTLSYCQGVGVIKQSAIRSGWQAVLMNLYPLAQRESRPDRRIQLT